MLDLEGKLVRIMPEDHFASGGKDHVSQVFVIKTMDEYPKEVAFSVFNKGLEKLEGLIEGDEMKVTFQPESKCRSDKYYTNLKAFNIEKIYR